MSFSLQQERYVTFTELRDLLIPTGRNELNMEVLRPLPGSVAVYETPPQPTV